MTPSMVQVAATLYGMSLSTQPRRRSLPSLVRMHLAPMESAMPWASHLCHYRHALCNRRVQQHCLLSSPLAVTQQAQACANTCRPARSSMRV